MTHLRQRRAWALLLVGTITTTALGGGVSGASLAGRDCDAPSTPATAPTGTALELLQKKGEAAIDRRLDSLEQLRTSVAGAAGIEPADRVTLEADIDAATAGLTAVRSTIEAGDSYRSVSDAVDTIVGTFRVYSVLVPKAHLVIGIALASEAAATLERVNRDLDASVTDDAERALLAWSDTASAFARARVEPVRSGVLEADAAGWPANKATLDAAKTALIDARQALGDALDATTRLAAGIPASS